MACKLDLLFRVLVITALMQSQPVMVIGEPQVPCYFVFGNSMVDNGNNNRFPRAEKANHPPYGIDLPSGVTRRFTNGLTASDIIGQLLGFPDFIPPYATATNKEISRGVNYGSAGAGIREETGSNLGDRISMDKQLLNHASIVSRLSVIQGNKTFTNEYLKKCIYTVSIGTEDYINNYIMPKKYPTRHMYTPDQYASVLIRQYTQQLRALYKLGARKVVVFGLGPIACTPDDIAIRANQALAVDVGISAAMLQAMIDILNNLLPGEILDLNNDLSYASFTFINSSGIASSTLEGNQSGSFSKGSSWSKVPCCQVRPDGLCVPNSVPCPMYIRNISAWYDCFHPSEIAFKILASRAYNAISPMDASPYDISRLVQL